MICPDCEMEVDKLVNTTNCCMLCYKRYQNAKSRGKEYIKLKDIKGTIEYNRAMGRRIAAIKRNNKLKIEDKKTTEETKHQIVKETITQIEGYEYIDVDSEKVLESVKYLYNAIDYVPKIQTQLNQISEDLINMQHEKENTNGFEDIEFQKLAKREYSILKYRRGLKNALSFLARINTNVLKKELIEELEGVKARYIDNTYTPKKTYKVSVNCTGLYGSPKAEIYTQTLLAHNEEEAKIFVKARLEGWNNVTIYGNSWKVEEL